ncbi:MAG: histidine kinase [Chloroflexi bacterium]|nr:histidine kinase [Chloroflexota bacterium]
MNSERIRELEAKIAEIKRRIPPHSVPPRMIEELEDLESELEREREADSRERKRWE